jgi:hypothetical protein
MARFIWLRRNAFVFRNEFASPVSIVMVTKENLETYSLVHRKEELVNSLGIPLEVWSKPKMGWMKLNWDAALDIPAKKLGLGVVVRDSCGVFVAAKAAVIPFISDPTTGEALAAWSATTLARNLGLQKVVPEGDCQPVIAAISQILLAGIVGVRSSMISSSCWFFSKTHGMSCTQISQSSSTLVG